MKAHYLFFIVMTIGIGMACSSSKSVSSSDAKSSKSSVEKKTGDYPAKDLSEYLGRVSGLSVTGHGSSARVTVRGMSSLGTDTEPLIVINGTPLSGGLANANATVLVEDIKSVRVLRSASEISFYGERGSTGVILIQLKQ